jgi:hypothetical protein
MQPQSVSPDEPISGNDGLHGPSSFLDSAIWQFIVADWVNEKTEQVRN